MVEIVFGFYSLIGCGGASYCIRCDFESGEKNMSRHIIPDFSGENMAKEVRMTKKLTSVLNEKNVDDLLACNGLAKDPMITVLDGCDYELTVKYNGRENTIKWNDGVMITNPIVKELVKLA